jgi:two-component system cell cycle response regulator
MPRQEETTFTALPRAADTARRHAFLIVLAGPQFGEVFPLEPGRERIIGRHGGSDLALLDDGVSRRHARILLDEGGALLSDLDSQNGTWVNGRRIREETRVADGARIQLGAHTTFKFVHADELEARYQQRVAEGALLDPLTVLHNRRHLEERLAAELAAAKRHGRQVSVAMVDVDHFKKVNDTHGHLVGDEALKLVALVLRGALRKEDVLARYGGEEFVVVGRETGGAGARAMGERLRRAVEQSRCTVGAVELAVTVSVGVATLTVVPDGTYEDAGHRLIGAADKALYAAKASGRNRVAVQPTES